MKLTLCPSEYSFEDLELTVMEFDCIYSTSCERETRVEEPDLYGYGGISPSIATIFEGSVIVGDVHTTKKPKHRQREEFSMISAVKHTHSSRP